MHSNSVRMSLFASHDAVQGCLDAFADCSEEVSVSGDSAFMQPEAGVHRACLRTRCIFVLMCHQSDVSPVSFPNKHTQNRIPWQKKDIGHDMTEQVMFVGVMRGIFNREKVDSKSTLLNIMPFLLMFSRGVLKTL